MSRIILASASPRRKELLNQIGLVFEILSSDKEEITAKKKPQEVVQEFSYQKAKDVFSKIEKESEKKQENQQDAFDECKKEEVELQEEETGMEDLLVIGADTIVYYDGKVFGKPGSKQEAYDMIKVLQGNTHEVYTGVTLAWKTAGKLGTYTFFEKTEVVIYPMEKEEIISYVKSGEPMDKAGAYAIQGHFGAYIKEIRGEYNNVVGLPVGRLFQEMKKRKLLS